MHPLLVSFTLRACLCTLVINVKVAVKSKLYLSVDFSLF